MIKPITQNIVDNYKEDIRMLSSLLMWIGKADAGNIYIGPAAHDSQDVQGPMAMYVGFTTYMEGLSCFTMPQSAYLIQVASICHIMQYVCLAVAWSGVPCTSITPEGAHEEWQEMEEMKLKALDAASIAAKAEGNDAEFIEMLSKAISDAAGAAIKEVDGLGINSKGGEG